MERFGGSRHVGTATILRRVCSGSFAGGSRNCKNLTSAIVNTSGISLTRFVGTSAGESVNAVLS